MNTFKTALNIAVEKENIEIIKLLLSQEGIDVNQQFILENIFFNAILHNIFIKLKLKYFVYN